MIFDVDGENPMYRIVLLPAIPPAILGLARVDVAALMSRPGCPRMHADRLEDCIEAEREQPE